MADDPTPTQADRDSHRMLDGAAYVIRGVVYGLFNSGFVRPLLVLGAVSSVLQRVTTEFLQKEYAQGGRPAYDQAKTAVLNLSTMARSDLDTFIRQMDHAVTTAELHTPDDTVTH